MCIPQGRDERESEVSKHFDAVSLYEEEEDTCYEEEEDTLLREVSQN